MAGSPENLSIIRPILQGDTLREDGVVERAGNIVTERQSLFPKEYAMEGWKDTVKRPTGEKGEQLWINFSEGAVMVVPVKRRIPLSRTIVLLGKDMMLYGTGDSNGIEALGTRKGQDRTADDATQVLIEDNGLKADIVHVTSNGLNDTSGRLYNLTEGYVAELQTIPSSEQLEQRHLAAYTLAETLRMIKRGEITNTATIAIIHLTREYLRDTSFPRSLIY